MEGRIQLIIGPMFSGKTTELIRLLKRYQFANYHCLVIKYNKDIRYNPDCVVSHDKQSLEAVKAAELSPFLESANDYDVIGIDEGQFFPDVVSFANEMAERGKIVLVAALDSTFEKKAFGDILQLIPLAENVVKLTAVCMNCYKEASFTKRIGNEKEVEVIGGADKYLCVCRKCYNLDTKPISKLDAKPVSKLDTKPISKLETKSISPLKETNKENLVLNPQQPETPKKSMQSLLNHKSPTANVEDYQAPPFVNIKINQSRGKLFSSP